LLDYIKGQLEEIGSDYVVIDVAGIGYKAYVSKNTAMSLSRAKSDVKLYTQLKLNDENIALYGFINKAERELYVALNSVSGVGPKAAMAILSSNTADNIIQAIINNDSKVLSSAPGIGVKTANRIIIDLKDKFGELSDFNSAELSGDELIGEKNTCIEALTSLGYSYSKASAMVNKTFNKDRSTQENILSALSAADSI